MFLRCERVTLKPIPLAGSIAGEGPKAINFSKLCDGDDMVTGRNADYGFYLFRNESEDRLTLREVVPNHNLIRPHRISRNLLRMSYPDFLWRESLLEVIEKPYFKLVLIEPDPNVEFPFLYKLEFEYPHEYQSPAGIFNWPQGGTLWLDAANCWAMVRCQVELLIVAEATPRLSKSIQEFEFSSTVTDCESQVRLPIRRSEYEDLPDEWSTQQTELYLVNWDPIPSNQFDLATTRLTHFGFGEPVFNSEVEPFIEFQISEPIELPAKRPTEIPFLLAVAEG